MRVRPQIIPIRMRVWYQGVLMITGSVLGLLAALMLSLEAYWRALNPHQVFSCDVNTRLSCSDVAASWQSTLIHTPDGAVPNAFLGLVAFAVTLTIGVVIACGWRPPEWFRWGLRAGVFLMLVFSTWLFEQSAVVIGAMCPWCLTMDVGSILLVTGVWREWAIRDADHHQRAWRFARGLESLLFIVVILIVIALVVLWRILS